MLNVKRMLPLCACCKSEDVLVCSREAEEFDVWVDIHEGIAHAFAIWLPDDQCWLVTGVGDFIVHREVDGEIIAFREVEWLEEVAEETSARRFDMLVDLIDFVEESGGNLSVAQLNGDSSITDKELRSGMPSFKHYCCSCSKNVSVDFIELPEPECGEREQAEPEPT